MSEKKCVKCFKPLDRRGFLCKACKLFVLIKSDQRQNRESREFRKNIQSMKQEMYDDIMKKVNDELDKEEAEK